MSICTALAWSYSGRNWLYGKLEPMVSSVSQSCIISYVGRVPSRPMEPVTHGSSSLRTSLPSSAFATPAPSRSATSVTSARAPRAPWPTRIATRRPR